MQLKAGAKRRPLLSLKIMYTEQPIINAILVHFSRYHIQIYSHYAIASIPMKPCTV